MRISKLAILAGLTCALTLQASAATWLFQAFLSGDQEVPPTDSPGKGVFAFNYDDATNAIDVIFLDVISLTANSTTEIVGTHIHAAPFGSNGPIIVDFLGGGAGSWSGMFGVFEYTQAGSLILPEDREDDLFAGNTYINVHTFKFGGGEIRGQINLVPEPATLVILSAGLGILAARRRNR
ncbi:MAG TPA: CHRD domain-containing protein [Fimbriimonadales bacterium]|nr:CHRD domain-containing protein [Fimbriimonadales bacterium]